MVSRKPLQYSLITTPFLYLSTNHIIRADTSTRYFFFELNNASIINLVYFHSKLVPHEIKHLTLQPNNANFVTA